MSSSASQGSSLVYCVPSFGLLWSTTRAIHKSGIAISSITLQMFSHWTCLLSLGPRTTSFQEFALFFMSVNGRCRCAYLSSKFQDAQRYSHMPAGAPADITRPVIVIWIWRDEQHIKCLVHFSHYPSKRQVFSQWGLQGLLILHYAVFNSLSLVCDVCIDSQRTGLCWTNCDPQHRQSQHRARWF